MLRLFISHAHEDKAIADSLRSLISTVFTSQGTQTVKASYSSDDAPEGGITPGVAWLDWILKVVSDTDVCVVILTDESVSAPWLTWEAGAVTGAALSKVSAQDRRSKVIPFLFGVGVQSMPAPLQHLKAMNGQRANDVLQFLFSLCELSSSKETFREEVARQHVDEYIRIASQALLERTIGKPTRFRLPADAASVYFTNVRSGLTLEPYGGIIQSGSILSVKRFTGDSHQAWKLYPVDDRLYRIVTANGAKCISVLNDSKRSGARICLWDYEQHETQHWKIVRHAQTSGAMSIVSIFDASQKLCLMPRPEDRQIVQTDWKNQIDQDWWIFIAPDF